MSVGTFEIRNGVAHDFGRPRIPVLATKTLTPPRDRFEEADCAIATSADDTANVVPNGSIVVVVDDASVDDDVANRAPPPLQDDDLRSALRSTHRAHLLIGPAAKARPLGP